MFTVHALERIKATSQYAQTQGLLKPDLRAEVPAATEQTTEDTDTISQTVIGNEVEDTDAMEVTETAEVNTT